MSNDDPNAKPSQTDVSFLLDKKKNDDDAENQGSAGGEDRTSFSRPNKMKYPTNFPANDGGETDDDRDVREISCKCSTTNDVKVRKLKGIGSDDEMEKKGCVCKIDKEEYDGIEDVCTANAMRGPCDGRRRSDAASNVEIIMSEDRLDKSGQAILKQPTSFGPNNPKCAKNHVCSGRRMDADDYDDDILIVSGRDIKSRGGFKPKTGDFKTKSWYRYGERPTASIQEVERYQRSEHYGRSFHFGDDGKGYYSCESSGSETSIVCRCNAQHSCRQDKSMPCICGKRSAKSNKSMESNYKSTCSVNVKKSDTKSMKSKDERCSDCGKMIVQGEATSNQNQNASSCGVCGQGQSPSKQGIPKSNAPCCQSSTDQPPPCDECQETPEVCEECGKNVAPSDSCLCENSKDDIECYCSTDSLTCRDDPAATCHTVASRKERIMRLLNNLTDVACCSTGPFADDRATIIEQLFQELTYLLGRDVASENKEKNLDCCLHKMKAYLEECFLKDLPPPKKKKPTRRIELYNVERDPDFVYPSAQPSKPAPCPKKPDGEDDDDQGGTNGGGGGREGGTSGDGGTSGGGEEEGGEGGTSSVKLHVVNIGEAGAGAGETFYGECDMCEDEVPTTECTACEEAAKSPCEEATPITDCNICDDNTPVPTDCNLCEEEMRMVRSGPCQDSEMDECNHCQCCHCRAMRRENECHTVSKTVECAMLDPVCELRYFIDSIIFDLDAMDQVLHCKKGVTRSSRPRTANDPCKDSFPVKITQVQDIGSTSLYVGWEILDCCGVSGYEIYIDGHLCNRLFSPGHQATVLCNVNINCPHQIILRATAIGEDYPDGVGGRGGCSKNVSRKPPDRGPGSSQPWKASIFYYSPC